MIFVEEVRIDIESGKVLSRAIESYRGPVAQCKGKQKSSTTVMIPPPSPEELEDRRRARVLNELSLRSSGYVFEPGGGARRLRPEELTPEEAQEEELTRLGQEYALKRARAGFGATPEEKETIRGIYGTARTRGRENIREFLSELSGSRGMDIASSSPLAREAGRAERELEEGLGGAQAAAELDFGERSRAFGQELRSFQEGLRQRALENRLGISGAYSGQAGALANLRGQQTTTTQKTKGGGGGFLSGIGGLASGAGALIGAFSLSVFKDNIRPASNIDALKVISELPIMQWNYKWEKDKEHIGPMADDINPILKSKDGMGLDMINVVGMLLMAVQQLAKRSGDAENGTP